MTKKFDENARLALKEELKLRNPFKLDKKYSPRHMSVKLIEKKEARKYIASFHYSKTFPDSTLFAYAGYYGKAIAGIICYGMGAGINQYKSILPNIKKGEYCELTRLWSPDNMPKNTESKIIGESIKLLPSRIKLLISFADDSHNHKGIIYQATNWMYFGINNGGKMMIDSKGIGCHSRLLGIYKMRHPELRDWSNKQIMDKYGFKFVEAGKKHRYVMIRGDRRYKRKVMPLINKRILPYPKLNSTTKLK